MNSLRPGRRAGAVQHPPPQQRGQRADVGEVRPDVHPDQHGEHDPGAGASPSSGEQQQHRRQVVEQVGQHRGHRGASSSPRQGGYGGQHRGQRRAQPVRRDRLTTTTPSASTNRQNGRSAAADQAPGRIRPATQRRAPSTSAPASATHTGSTPEQRRRTEPGAASGPAPPARTAAARGRTGRAVVVGRRGSGPAPGPRGTRAGRPGTRSPMHHQPRRAISAAKPMKDSPDRRERQQVGQVRHRQQQRRRVGQVRAGVDVRAGPHPQQPRGGQHHRGQQHHGRVQAEHRRGDRGGDEGRVRAAAPAGPRLRTASCQPSQLNTPRPRPAARAAGSPRGTPRSARARRSSCPAAAGVASPSSNTRPAAGAADHQLRQLVRPDQREAQHESPATPARRSPRAARAAR